MPLNPRFIVAAFLLGFVISALAHADDIASKDEAQDQPAARQDDSAKPKDAAEKQDPAKEKEDPKNKDANEKKPDEKKPEVKKLEEKKPDEKKPAADTAPKKDDPDFALQGEFAGPVTTAPSKYEHVALQIRPMGGGGFEAAQYQGGLPGEPGQRKPPVMLLGKRSADFLVLSGGPWAVFVEQDHCLLVDREGQRVGRLERVHRESTTVGAVPPKDAIVLFDGKGTDHFTTARMTEDGLLMEGADIKPMFQDFNMHLEFLLPYMPAARDQGRANSGVYLQSRYEVQVLDSFAEEPRFNGCGGLYRFRAADVNMCFPPLVWQTYDIAFTAPRWGADNKKLKNAVITVWQNGVKIHNSVELDGPTGAGKAEEPNLLPIKLQNHGNPVRFRNIWIVDRGAAPTGQFSIIAKAASPPPAPAKSEAPAEKKTGKDNEKTAEAKPGN